MLKIEDYLDIKDDYIKNNKNHKQIDINPVIIATEVHYMKTAIYGLPKTYYVNYAKTMMKKLY